MWSREESIVGHHKRHPFHITTKWGAKRDGTIVAVETRTVADGGAYASTSVEVLKCATIFAQGPYRVPNVSTDGIVVYTNNVPSGAFRGFGSPQAQFAAESMVTRLALRLGIDPVVMRRRNLYDEGSLEPTQQAVPHDIITFCPFGHTSPVVEHPAGASLIGASLIGASPGAASGGLASRGSLVPLWAENPQPASHTTSHVHPTTSTVSR